MKKISVLFMAILFVECTNISKYGIRSERIRHTNNDGSVIKRMAELGVKAQKKFSLSNGLKKGLVGLLVSNIRTAKAETIDQDYLRRMISQIDADTYIKEYEMNNFGFEFFKPIDLDNFNADIYQYNNTLGIVESFINSNGNYRNFAGKINSDGSYAWAKNIQKPQDGPLEFTSITKDPVSGDYITLGFSESGISIGRMADDTGDIVWYKEIVSNVTYVQDYYGSNIITSSDENFVFVSNNNVSSLLIKANRFGQLIWEQQYTVLDTLPFYPETVIELTNGCFVTGSITYDAVDLNILYYSMNKFFPNGTHIDSLGLPISYNGFINSTLMAVPTLAAFPNSTFVAVGITTFGLFDHRPFITYNGPNLEPYWYKVLDLNVATPFSNGGAVAVTKTEDDQILLTIFNLVSNVTGGNTESLADFVKIDLNGDIIFQKSITSDNVGIDIITIPQVTEEGRIFMLGYEYEEGNRYLVSTDSNATVGTCIEDTSFSITEILQYNLVDFDTITEDPEVHAEEYLVAVTDLGITDEDVCIPTSSPTNSPTNAPTNTPSNSPTNAPSNAPTDSPSLSPSNSPTEIPTDSPTDGPTNSPSDSPTNSPSNSPTDGPTDSPSDSPTNSPSNSPSNSPTEIPTNSPSNSPSNSPTDGPTNSPSGSPTFSPTHSPTATPTQPTASPTDSPTDSPTKNDSKKSNNSGHVLEYVVVSVGALLFCVFLIILWMCCCKKNGYRRI